MPEHAPQDRDLSRSGQIALVTGGSSGLGAAIAQALAAAGTTVVVTSRGADRAHDTLLPNG